MLKIGFIINGKKGRRKRLDQEIQSLTDRMKKYEIKVSETQRAGDATLLAKEMANHGFSHIIAVGGDGTLNETLNGIKKSVHANCHLGMLTYGTANDFAKTVHAPRSLAQLLDAIDQQRHRQLDVGLIEQQVGDLTHSRYFINIADLGIGAEVVKKVNKSSKIFGSDITFFSAIVSTFLSYKNQPIKCITESWTWEGKANSLVMANGKYFGSGMCIAPDADPEDGQLAIVITGDISIWDYLKNVSKIKKAKRLNHPKVEYRTARKLVVNSPSLDCYIEADGEFIGGMPATISVVPQGINFIA